MPTKSANIENEDRHPRRVAGRKFATATARRS